MGSAAQRDRLAGLIEPVVASLGYDLEDVSVNPAGRRSLLRVVVDGDNGVALDDVAQVSKKISAVLDDADGVMGRSPYVLEVTSPGAERPLTQPRHWRRSVGRMIKLDAGEKAPSSGRVIAADDSGVDLDVDGSVQRVNYSAVRSARVQIEFNHSEGGRS